MISNSSVSKLIHCLQDRYFKESRACLYQTFVSFTFLLFMIQLLFFYCQADLIYKMSAAESFAFGSMISAVDPVATLAIFQALNVLFHFSFQNSPR